MALFGNKVVKFNGIDFIPISNLTKKEFDEYYIPMDFEIKMVWQMNYTYIMTSENAQKSHYYKIVNDMLCIFQKYHKGLAMLCFPIGKCNSKKMFDTLKECFDIMVKCSESKYQVRIDWVNQQQIDFVGADKIKASKMIDKKSECKDYVYDPYMVSCMEGSDYRYIRRKINKFDRDYPNAIIREYEDKDYPQMQALADEWKHYVKEEVGRYDWLVDANYYKNTLLHHKELDHKVFVCELDGKIIGMVSGGMLIDGEYAWCFNRKPLNQYDGLSEKLVWFICDFFKDATYLNDGSGSSGLSFFKERFRPVYENLLYVVNGVK